MQPGTELCESHTETCGICREIFCPSYILPSSAAPQISLSGPRGRSGAKKSLKGPETRNSLQVCQFFCVNGQVLSLRNSLQGRHAFRQQNREVVWPNGLTAVEAADLSDPEAIHVLVRQLDARNLHGDVLVNNAGLGNLNCSKDHPGAESARSSKSTLLPCSASRIIFCLR